LKFGSLPPHASQAQTNTSHIPPLTSIISSMPRLFVGFNIISHDACLSTIFRSPHPAQFNLQGASCLPGSPQTFPTADLVTHSQASKRLCLNKINRNSQMAKALNSSHNPALRRTPAHHSRKFQISSLIHYPWHASLNLPPSIYRLYRFSPRSLP
jgi:hypothetical protein